MKRINTADVTKEELCLIISTLGCPLIKQKIKEHHTKEEVIAILKRCDCPVLKKLFH